MCGVFDDNGKDDDASLTNNDIGAFRNRRFRRLSLPCCSNISSRNYHEKKQLPEVTIIFIGRWALIQQILPSYFADE